MTTVTIRFTAQMAFVLLFVFFIVLQFCAILNDKSWVTKLDIGQWDWRYTTNESIKTARVFSVIGMSCSLLALLLYLYQMSSDNLLANRRYLYTVMSLMVLAGVATMIVWIIVVALYAQVVTFNGKVNFEYGLGFGIVSSVGLIGCAVIAAYLGFPQTEQRYV